jgi:hypothetical protein
LINAKGKPFHAAATGGEDVDQIDYFRDLLERNLPCLKLIARQPLASFLDSQRLPLLHLLLLLHFPARESYL